MSTASYLPGWPRINPGKMIHWVTFLAEKEMIDISGTETIYVPFLSTWAQIDPVRGLDVLRSGQATTTLFLTVTIYWQAGILPDQRIQTVSGDTYVIQAIENPGNRNVILICNCVQLGHKQ